MNFTEYQTATNKTSVALERLNKKFPDIPKELQFILTGSYLGLGLGESGEVQGKLKKLLIRDKPGEFPNKEELDMIKKELGDMLWYISETATLFKLSLDDIAQANIHKLVQRKEEGILHGSGDNRTSLVDEANLANKGYFVIPLHIKEQGFVLLSRKDTRTPSMLYIVGDSSKDNTKQLYGFTAMEKLKNSLIERSAVFGFFSSKNVALKFAALLDADAINLITV